ncbi:Hypothetical predicted protein [Podarcis lilfordi]|uniref:Uncharacterized protein n=1 Tax=Podarcis lilfordi TaxID=74358 RepID=A0AA35K9W7_9SAUR|nr:Hypothetical predicted protein [Podarcis lilfordi]
MAELSPSSSSAEVAFFFTFDPPLLSPPQKMRNPRRFFPHEPKTAVPKNPPPSMPRDPHSATITKPISPYGSGSAKNKLLWLLVLGDDVEDAPLSTPPPKQKQRRLEQQRRHSSAAGLSFLLSPPAPPPPSPPPPRSDGAANCTCYSAALQPTLGQHFKAERPIRRQRGGKGERASERAEAQTRRENREPLPPPPPPARHC